VFLYSPNAAQRRLRFASSNRYRGDRRLISILLKNPPFILREPQDERRGIDNVKNFPFMLSPSKHS
jgi:hypothetical protein